MTEATAVPRTISPLTATRLAALRLQPADRDAVTMLLQGYAPAVVWKSTALGNHREFLACVRRVRAVMGAQTYDDMLAWFAPPPPAGVGATAPAAAAPAAAQPESVCGGLKLTPTIWGFTYTYVDGNDK